MRLVLLGSFHVIVPDELQVFDDMVEAVFAVAVPRLLQAAALIITPIFRHLSPSGGDNRAKSMLQRPSEPEML